MCCRSIASSVYSDQNLDTIPIPSWIGELQTGCSLLGGNCVYPVVTDIGVIEVTKNGMVLKEVAAGWTADDVQALTKPKLIVAPDLKEVAL